MDILRESFRRVRQDIESLKIELGSLKLSLTEMVWRLDEINILLKDIKNRQKAGEKQETDLEKPAALPSTHIIQIPLSSTYSSTENSPFDVQKAQIKSFSIGNKGVPTDRQTDQQTDKYEVKNKETLIRKEIFHNSEIPIKKDIIKDAADILDSLDALKKEIRLKFKRLTEREWSVFSTMYQLEEEKGFSDYKSIAERLNLTESSIRDYVAKLLEKGIPVDKTKLNNKNIQFKISDSLKKIAALPTIMQLRDI